jgi:hypothetical protein
VVAARAVVVDAQVAVVAAEEAAKRIRLRAS